MTALQFGLAQETIAKITSVFARHKEVEEVLIYGSRAKGNFKKGSDIDLTLQGADIDLRLLNKISLELDELLLPYSFDLSIHRQITEPNLLAHIQRVGKVLHKNNRNL